MKGIDKLARPFDVSLHIGDAALEQLCGRWLAHAQDGSGPARTLQDLLNAIQPGLTISPTFDALQLAPPATETFHRGWAKIPPSQQEPSAQLRATSVKFSSGTSTGTVCRREWQCPGVFLPAARVDTLRTEAKYSGFGPDDVGVAAMVSRLTDCGVEVAWRASKNVGLPNMTPTVFNTYVTSLGNWLGSPPFEEQFLLDRRGLKAGDTSLTYRYLHALGAESEVTGPDIHAASLPSSHALLAWIWLVRKIRTKDALGAEPWQLANLVPNAVPSGVGMSQQQWDDWTRDLRTLLDGVLRAPAFFHDPVAAEQMRVKQGQLPFVLLNLIWLTPALLLSSWRLGPAKVVPPPGQKVWPSLLGIGLDGRCQVRSTDGGVRGDFVFTGADILAGMINDGFSKAMYDVTKNQNIVNAVPIIGEVGATAALPAHSTARLMLAPLVQRLKLTSDQADKILATSGAPVTGGALGASVSLVVSPFFLGAVAELAADVALGAPAFADDARPMFRDMFVKYREIADDVASTIGLVTFGAGKLPYMNNVRPVLNALIEALATPNAPFQAVASANLDLALHSSGPGAARVTATLTALDGKLRVRMEADLLPVADIPAFTATTGTSPTVIALTLVDVRLKLGSLGELDVMGMADALYFAAQQPAKLAKILKSFFGYVGGSMKDVGSLAIDKAMTSLFGGEGSSGGTSPPGLWKPPSLPLGSSPSQQIGAQLASAASRANSVLQLAMQRFTSLLPVKELRWTGGASLGLDVIVDVPELLAAPASTSIPTPVTTPWPTGSSVSFATVLESLQPMVASSGQLTSDAFVRVGALERYELEFDPKQWSPWAALCSSQGAWKGAAPCEFGSPTMTLEDSPPIPVGGNLKNLQEPAFLGSYVAAGTYGSPAFVIEPWALVVALQFAVQELAKAGAKGNSDQLLQALIAAASSDGKHRMARLVVSAMPHQTVALLADYVVWLAGKPSGPKVMAALGATKSGLVLEHLKTFSLAIRAIWQLPATLSHVVQERRQQLLVPVLSGAPAEVLAQWLRADWSEVGWQPGAGIDDASPIVLREDPVFPRHRSPPKDPFGGKGPKWGRDG